MCWQDGKKVNQLWSSSIVVASGSHGIRRETFSAGNAASNGKVFRHRNTSPSILLFFLMSSSFSYAACSKISFLRILLAGHFDVALGSMILGVAHVMQHVVRGRDGTQQENYIFCKIPLGRASIFSTCHQCIKDGLSQVQISSQYQSISMAGFFVVMQPQLLARFHCKMFENTL